MLFEAHFQTFDDPSGRENTPQRIGALRRVLRERGLDALMVPHADRQHNEYLPACEERLAWLTGFTGSAGTAIILQDRAVLFVDGRYILQAQNQVVPTLIEVVPLAEKSPEAWIEANLPAQSRLGYDPWLYAAGEVEKLAAACKAADATLVALDSNPIDAVWDDRPPAPLGKVSLHDLSYAGEDVANKLNRVREAIREARAGALVVSNPASVAWTFNIRGEDVAHTPIALSFAIIPAEGRPTLYIDGRKLDNAVRASLEEHAAVQETDALPAGLADLGASGLTVRLDQATASEALGRFVTDAGGKALRGPDPIALMKAVKNPVEIAGARAAQRRDGAAFINFLAWFDRVAPGGELTEIEAVKALETFRRQTGVLKEISFPTIAGSGPNGAIVHYRVTEASNRRILPGELFLLDSGAQYLDGTTDITRTIAVGTPTAEMCRHFTLVLKGHIAIARAVFPDGVAGAQLDPFARQHLWRAGLDYDHGTGHGVGSYLSVHEGPASIHKSNLTALKRGMILSNEPGYYKPGAYGIRIENLVLVVAAAEVEGADKPLNTFETLTWAPIDRRLVERTLLTPDELSWLDAYHARVWEETSSLVADDAREWLRQATLPLA